MKFGRYLAAAAAASLSIAPATAASFNPAASMSLGKSIRAGSSSTHGDDLLASGGGFLIALIIVAGIGTGLGLSVGNDGSAPTSP